MVRGLLRSWCGMQLQAGMKLVLSNHILKRISTSLAFPNSTEMPNPLTELSSFIQKSSAFLYSEIHQKYSSTSKLNPQTPSPPPTPKKTNHNNPMKPLHCNRSITVSHSNSPMAQGSMFLLLAQDQIQDMNKCLQDCCVLLL